MTERSKPGIYKKLPNGSFERIATQCSAHLPFHHEDYVLCSCGLREGHTGQHQCARCQRTFEVTP